MGLLTGGLWLQHVCSCSIDVIANKRTPTYVQACHSPDIPIRHSVVEGEIQNAFYFLSQPASNYQKIIFVSQNAGSEGTRPDTTNGSLQFKMAGASQQKKKKRFALVI